MALELVVRASAPLAAAWVLFFLYRRRSAAVRHFVLAAGVAMAAVSLPLTLVMPAWEMPGSLAGASLPSSGPTAAVDTAAGGSIPVVQDASAPGVSVPETLLMVWLAGSALLLLPTLAGLVALRRVRRRAVGVSDDRWPRLRDEVASALGVTRPVRLLQGDVAVGTWGLLHPSIVVPLDADSWPEERIRAVLAHELAHVRRGDWAVQLAADVMRAACWLNPMFWMASRRLRDESERACDDVVIRSGIQNAAFATHLLDIARGSRGTPPAAAMAMARPSTLEGRITAMLNPNVDRQPPARWARLGTVMLLLVSALLGAVRTAAQVAGPAALEGFVYDSSGAVLPGVELALENDQGVKWTTTTDRTGHFEFVPVGAGSYVLEASIPGFKSFRQPLALKRERDWSQAITLQVGELEETITVTARRPSQPTPPPAPANSAGVVRVGGNIKQPAKVFDARPVYPPAMQAAGLEGVVKLAVLIGVDGTVASVRAISTQIHPDFAAAAAAAVEQWRFTPTLLNGRPVEVAMTASISFTLSD